MWRNNPAPPPDPPFSCVAADWGDAGPSASTSIVECRRPVFLLPDILIQYYRAQCDEFIRTSGGWTRLKSASRLKLRKAGFDDDTLGGGPDCFGCPGLSMVDVPMVSARDELVIQFLPLPDAKPLRVSLRAKTRVVVEGRLAVSNCDQSSATGTVHAKTVFKPGIWSAEIDKEMALKDQGVLEARVNQSMVNPGQLIPTGTGFSVGGGGGAMQIGYQRQGATVPSMYLAVLNHPRGMNFYAKWCVSPPIPGTNVVEFIASVDLEVDTHATQTAAHEASAVSTAETEVLKFGREKLYPAETPCATCSGGQPARGPVDFPGGGGSGG